MKVIDGQVHICMPEAPDRPWLEGGLTRAQLPYALTYQRLLPMMDEAGVDRAILVPPSWEGDRNDHALEGAAKDPDRFAVMGRMAIDQPANAKLLRDWRKTPGMLGIRLTFVLEREREWLRNGTTDWFWAAAEQDGVPVMMHATGLIPYVGAIAARHPALKMTIDHFGFSSAMAKQGRHRECIDATTSLARHKNVFVKVSAAPVYSQERYPFRDLDDHIKRVIDAFGPRRCFWGTDLSHALEKATYRECVTHFTEELSFLSAQDKEWIMGRSLAECLGWPL